jgi:hypothetical protein
MITQKPWLLIPAHNPSVALKSLVNEMVVENVFEHIIIINDGSSLIGREIIFELAGQLKVTILEHAINRGKGQALKTGLNYYLLKSLPDNPGIVTADADGQHLAEDIKKVAIAGLEGNDSVLGVRVFSRTVPLKSRFGNIVTRNIYRLFLGRYLSDTQTGLRFCPRRLVGGIIQVPYDRFEFEFAVLVQLGLSTEKITEVPIETVYLNHNITTHFRPLVDSAQIYMVFLKYFKSPIIIFLLDYLIFVVLMLNGCSFIKSLLVAKLIGATINVVLSSRWRFIFNHIFFYKFLSYVIILIILAFLSFSLTMIFTSLFAGAIIFSKLLSELILFFIGLGLYNRFVFLEKKRELFVY